MFIPISQSTKCITVNNTVWMWLCDPHIPSNYVSGRTGYVIFQIQKPNLCFLLYFFFLLYKFRRPQFIGEYSRSLISLMYKSYHQGNWPGRSLNRKKKSDVESGTDKCTRFTQFKICNKTKSQLGKLEFLVSFGLVRHLLENRNEMT